VLASTGNLYGTTSNGGNSGSGVVFEITPAGALRTLHSFCAQGAPCSDGQYPYSGLVQASNGNLYGTTLSGGANYEGEVYEITPMGQFKVIYSFCALQDCGDGSTPYAGLIQAANGNLYGATYSGGAFNYGTVFQITPTGQLTTLHSFDNSDGAYPTYAPTQANDGNLYGTTSQSLGVFYGGTIYEITAAGEFTSLYAFCNFTRCTGLLPLGGLAQDTDGTFYGTTWGASSDAYDGTVYSYSTGLSPLVETVPAAAKPGARVIILGNNLTGSTNVTFNGTPATFTVESDTYITATVPTGAATGTVQVTTPSGTLDSNPSFQVLK
jgi:uncharacterized repeat protein (TIGR03803 family)